MAELVWEDPPEEAAETFRNLMWGDTVAELKESPGKWARINIGDREPRNVAYMINRATTKAWKPLGAFEARYTPDGVWAVYKGE